MALIQFFGCCFCNYYMWLSQNHLLFTYCIKNSLRHVSWKLALWVRSSCLFFIHCSVTCMSAICTCTQELCPLCTCVSVTWGYQLISIEVLCHHSLTPVHSWRANCQKSSEPTRQSAPSAKHWVSEDWSFHLIGHHGSHLHLHEKQSYQMQQHW